MTPAEPPDPRAGRGSGDDPFSWLYQRGHPSPTEDAAPPVPPTVSNPTPGPARPESTPTAPPSPPPPPVNPVPAGPPPGPPPPYADTAFQAPPATPAYAPVPYVPPADAPRRRGLVVGVVAGIVLLAVVCAVVVAVLLNRRTGLADDNPIGPQAPTSRRASTAAVRPAATGVTADCTAPPATDDAGRPVAYDARNVSDGNKSTAWRCDGNGRGHTLTFTFPAGTTIGNVGLINGYAKTDPASGAKRYGEYRRITRVTWTLGNGRVVTQNLRDGTQQVQQISVPPAGTERVTLTIERSTKPGRKADSRDAVLISEVTFG